jgi:hypothetical protein
VQRWMRQWLEHELTTDELNKCVQRHLTGDHPDDSAIREAFRWFVVGSVEYHENTRSLSASPRSLRSSADSGRNRFNCSGSLPPR